VRVLVAEDDPGLRSVLERGLAEAGYVVDAVGDGAEALAYLRSYEYEVAVLDWRMPGKTGLEVVAELRRRRIEVPVLMLTARDLAGDRIAGLDAGADDYVVKPFDFGELLARLRALGRRPSAVRHVEVNLGDLTFDPTVPVFRLAGKELPLGRIESRILELLLKRSPAVVTRQSIALNAWQVEADAVGSNTIDVHIGRLRSKLGGSSVRIDTVRGAGYRLIGPRP
jgi:two-component system OmpR family response regulator